MFFLVILIYVSHIVLLALPHLTPQPRFMYSCKKKGLVPLTSATVVTGISPRPNNSVLIAYAKIYLLSLTIVTGLFSYFAALNFWHGDFLSGDAMVLPSKHILLAYLKLSAGLVFPLFFLLQVMIQRRRSGRAIFDCGISLQSIEHSALYCYLVLNIVPLLELAKLGLGLSGFQPFLIRSFVLWGAVEAICPIIVVMLVATFKRTSAAYNLHIPNLRSLLTYGFSLKNREYNLMVSDSDFTVDQLEDKPDNFVIKLIDVAWHLGDREKAELISNYLVMRQKAESRKILVSTDEPD